MNVFVVTFRSIFDLFDSYFWIYSIDLYRVEVEQDRFGFCIENVIANEMAIIMNRYILI